MIINSWLWAHNSAAITVALLSHNIVAITVDTCQALERLHGTAPTLLVTTESKIVAPWIDAHVSLSRSPSLPSWATTVQNCIPISGWKAEIQDYEQESSNQPVQQVEYLVSKSPEDGPQIHWKCPRRDGCGA